MVDRTVSVRLQAITSDFTAGMARAATATGALANQTAAFTRTHKAEMNTAGTAVLGLGAATLAGAGMAGKAAMDFESSFAGVRKTVDATEAELAGLSTGFREMATDIPVTVNEINRIGEAAGQLGIDTGNIEGFTRVMADLGVTTNMASDQAATSLARLANITQMPQTEFDRLGSTVVDLGNNLATTESEIVEMGLRLAGAGAQVGLAEAEILGLAGSLSSVGINAEAGGSAISRVMIEIASQVETSGDLLDEFASVAGMSAQEFSTAWRDDAAMALVAFVEGLGSMEEQGGSTLQTLEALEITEIRMRDALLRASGAGDLMRQSLESGNRAWEENNALTEEAAQRYETAESRIQIAKNQLYDLAIDVGAGVLPVMVSVAETGAGIARAFGDLPGPLKSAGGTAMVAAGGMATLAGGALLLAPRIVATKDALAALNVTMGTLGRASVWGLVAAGAISLGKAFTDARADARALAEEIAATSDTTEEAVRRIRDELEAFAEEAGGTDRTMGSLGNTLLGPIGAFFNLRNEISKGSTAWELWRTEVADVPEAMGKATYAATEFTPAAGRAAEVTDEMRAAAEAAGVDIDSMTESTEEAESAFGTLAPSIEAAFQALGDGFDPMSRYGELLTEMNEANRTAAEETAAATDDQADSWEDYFDETEASFDAYMQSLDQTLEDQRAWHTNLNTIREAAGDAYADLLAAQGPEFASLHAEIAAQSEDEIRAAAERALTIRQEATDEAVQQLLRSEPEWVDAAGQVSEATVAEIAEKLDTTPDVVRAAIDRSVPAMEAAMANLATVAGIGAAQVVGSVIGELNLGATQIAGVVADWETALRRGLAPFPAIVNNAVQVVDAPAVLGPSRGRLHPQARATGGPVMPGEPYLVGEEGPELVTFGASGMVHSAPETRQMMAAWSQPMTPAGPGSVPGGTPDQSRHVSVTNHYPKPEPPSKTLAAAHAEMYLAGL